MKQESDPQGSKPSSQTLSESPEGNKHSATKTRKRTKTGCLTCRKRRIKCDEGHPTCHNCYKSKRQCEGYQANRLQFRQNSGGPDFGPTSMNYPFVEQMSDFRPAYSNQGQFASILPRPLQGNGQRQGLPPQNQTAWVRSPATMEDETFSQAQLSELVAAQTNMPASAPAYLATFPDAVLSGQLNQTVYSDMPDSAGSMVSPVQPDESDSFAGMAGTHPEPPALLQDGFVIDFHTPNPISPDGNVWNPVLQAYDQNLYISAPPDHFNFADAVLEQELYDAESDDERGGALDRSGQTGLPMMMSIHGAFDVRALRANDTFLNTPNILVGYEPEWHASPLMNPTTARVFGHFIAVTACHLSLGQRRASNPSLLFQSQAVPKSQQGLWTYVLPQKALSNQGLLHAMLAVASMQIAMLQGSEIHTARKHYHFAIRRNSKAVASPKKRTSIATIATTLLLAHFEVWAADHSNWNSHLVGARQLLMEADLARMTKQMKKQKITKNRAAKHDDPYSMYLQPKAGPELQADSPDESILEQFMGYKVPYGDYVASSQDDEPRLPLTQADVDTYETYADLFWYFLKQDIYYSTISSHALMMPYERWGDCPPRAPIGRLDAIYGTSDHLLLIFGRIARFMHKDIARKKAAVKANGGRWQPPPGIFTQGGPPARAAGVGVPSPDQHQPDPRTAPNSSPSSNRAGFANVSGAGAGPTTPPGPSFMGMIPDPPTPRMPQHFGDGGGVPMYVPPKTDESEFDDLEEATRQALAEWADIQAALASYEMALQGPEWQPLPLHAAAPIATHFGSALQYEDYRIADLWAMFYVGKIIMARIHPSMPPAALVAAGVCAQQTASWAETVGKIVFGMQTPKKTEPVNPTFASVLMQNMYVLFIAGVQYREPEQRLIVVQRLQYIAEKVGHDSSALIAAALETCWINAYMMGRGPEWQRTLGLAIDTGDEDRADKFRTVERRKDGAATVYIRRDDVRTNFGMGVMGLDSDFSKMNMK